MRIIALVLTLSLATAISCAKAQVSPNELVGEWLARRVIFKRDGQPYMDKSMRDRECVLRFSADGRFAMDDRSGTPSIATSGSYEITHDHRLKWTYLDVQDPTGFTEGLRGRTLNLDFNVSGDQLSLARHYVSEDGKRIDEETSYVKAPK